tara:strand:- start:595 stop:1497 length:903 start_codon:yes stop_codon:yes gene_type:complete
MTSLTVIDDLKQTLRFTKNTLKRKVAYNPSEQFNEIQIETVSVCNRSCDFCPNSVLAPPAARMSSILLQKIATELADMDYAGKIGLYLRNEPFMDKSLNDHVRLFKEFCPKSFIYIATDGDLVTVEKLQRIFEAGISSVALSAYDGKEQVLTFNNMAKQLVSQYPRVNYVSGRGDIDDETKQYIWVTDYTYKSETFFNRANNVDIHAKLKKPLPLMCILPFKQLCITATGDVALCCADWYAEAGLGNAKDQSLLEIWFSPEFTSYREALSRFDRSKKLCNQCTNNWQDLPKVLVKYYLAS